MKMDMEGDNGKQVTIDYEMVDFQNLVSLFDDGYFAPSADDSEEKTDPLTAFGALCVMYYLENLHEADEELFGKLCKAAGESVEVGGMEVDTSQVEDLTIGEFGQYCLDRFHRQLDDGLRCHECHALVETANPDCVEYGLCEAHLEVMEL